MISPSFSGGIINYWNCPSVIAIVDCFFFAFNYCASSLCSFPTLSFSLSLAVVPAVSLLFCNLIWQQVRRDPVFNRTKHCRQSISRKTFPLIFPWQQNQKKVEEKIVEFFSVLAVEDKLFASVLCACCLFSFRVWSRYGRGGEGERRGYWMLL